MANMIQRSVVGSTVNGLVPNTVIKCNISNGIADCNTTQMTLSSKKQRFDPNLDELRAIRADLESQRFSYHNGMWKEEADYPLSPFAALSPIYNSFGSPQAFLSLSPSSSDSGLSLSISDESFYDVLFDDKLNKSVGDELTLNKMMIDDEASIDLFPMSQFTPPPSNNFLSESSSSAIVSPAASTSELTYSWESSTSPASSDSSYSSYSPKRQRQQHKSKRLVKKPKIEQIDAVKQQKHFPKPKKCIHIRDFLLDLLLNPSKYNVTGYAKWLNIKEGLFYVMEPEKVAALWAKIKNNKSASWKNFTRSIRSAGEDNGDFETVERRQGYGKWYVVKFGDRFRAQNELYKQALLLEQSEC